MRSPREGAPRPPPTPAKGAGRGEGPEGKSRTDGELLSSTRLAALHAGVGGGVVVEPRLQLSGRLCGTGRLRRGEARLRAKGDNGPGVSCHRARIAVIFIQSRSEFRCRPLPAVALRRLCTDARPNPSRRGGR